MSGIFQELAILEPTPLFQHSYDTS